MPKIKSKVVRVKDAEGIWHDMPAVISKESIRAAEAAHAYSEQAAESAEEARIAAQGAGKDYITPEMFGAVGEGGVVIIDRFNEMLAYAAANQKNVALVSDIELQFYQNDDLSTNAERGSYYKTNPIRLNMEGAKGIEIDGMGHTIRMTGLTRAYQETVLDTGGTAYDFFDALVLRQCDDIAIRNLHIKGEYVYYNYPTYEGEPEDAMGYNAARAIGIALRGCYNISITSCTFDGILGNGINIKSASVDLGGGRSGMKWSRGITCSDCVFTNILEDSFDVMAGAENAVITNCTFYNDKHGVETANQLSNTTYEDESIYSGEPYLHSTLVSNCWFMDCNFGVISNSTDCVTNCAFIETRFRVGPSSRSVFSNCIVRPNRPVSIYNTRGKARFSNIKFLYPRIAHEDPTDYVYQRQSASAELSGPKEKYNYVWIPDITVPGTGDTYLYNSYIAAKASDSSTAGDIEFADCTFEFGDKFRIDTTYRTMHFAGCLFQGGTLEDGQHTPIKASAQTFYISNTQIGKIHNSSTDPYSVKVFDCEPDVIPSEGDLNSYLWEGITHEYRAETDSTLANAPEAIRTGSQVVGSNPAQYAVTTRFRLYVEKLNHAVNRSVLQILITIPTAVSGTPTIYSRILIGAGWTAWAEIGSGGGGAGYEQTSNKVTAITGSSTDVQYPSAKAVWDTMEAKSNKVTAITAESTDVQYPSARSVYDIVAENAMMEFTTPVTLGSSDWINSRFIYVANGNGSIQDNQYGTVGMTDAKSRVSVAVEIPAGADQLVYTRRENTSSTTSAGTAFYGAAYSDAEPHASYISGIRDVAGTDAYGYELTTADIPTGAKYVRFTWFGTDSAVSSFTNSFSATFVAHSNFPDLLTPPSADGTYVLQATVSSGAVTYAWVSAT